jgi:hypothetical protein
MRVTEGFDLKDWAIQPEDSPKCDAGGAKPAPKRCPSRLKANYIPAMPLWWSEHYAADTKTRLLWYVLRQYRINSGKPVAVPNTVLGIPRATKNRCLAKLVQLGILKRGGDAKAPAYVPVFDSPKA